MALRILHIASSMPDDWGGIERYISYLSEAQVRAGQSVAVAAVPGSPLASRLVARQVPVRLANKYDLRALGTFLRIFRAEPWDVAVAHFSPDYLVPAWAARLAGGPAMILTRHVAVPLKPARARQYRGLYRGFVAVSGAVAETVCAAGILGCKVAHPGVPDPGVRSFPRPPLRACVVGRLVREKGQRIAMEASVGSKWGWDFAGSGPDEDALHRMLGSNTRMLGSVSDPAGVMARSHVVVIPSTWVEAFGLVAVEAMAVGRCVVASARGGLVEIVQPGVTGLLVPPSDPAALREAMETMDLDRARAMGHAGRLRYEEGFTVEAMERRTTAAYETILAS